MTTPAKLYGKDLSEYDDIDVDTLLSQLSAEEINILAKEVDPDVSSGTLDVLLRDVIFDIYISLSRCRIHFYRPTSVQATSVQSHQRVH